MLVHIVKIKYVLIDKIKQELNNISYFLFRILYFVLFQHLPLKFQMITIINTE